jgi:hypothetical protein
VTWFSLALALLKFANMLLEWRLRESLLNEGEKRQVAKQLAEITKRTSLLKEVDEKIEKATDQEILEVLKNDFRD